MKEPAPGLADPGLHERTKHGAFSGDICMPCRMLPLDGVSGMHRIVPRQRHQLRKISGAAFCRSRPSGQPYTGLGNYVWPCMATFSTCLTTFRTACSICTWRYKLTARADCAGVCITMGGKADAANARSERGGNERQQREGEWICGQNAVGHQWFLRLLVSPWGQRPGQVDLRAECERRWDRASIMNAKL